MISLLTLVALAAEPMTLDQALDVAARAPDAQVAALEADAARSDAATAWLASTLPVVGGTLTSSSRTRELAIDTPIGPFVQQPKDVVTAGVRGSWPVLDPAGLFGRGPAASAAARALQSQADRAVDVARLTAAQAFLDVVTVDAQRDALAALVDSLAVRQDQARALVDAGQAITADVLRVEVAASEAQAGLARATQGAIAARQRLAWTLGLDTTVDPDFTWARPSEPPMVEQVLPDALASRPDVRALHSGVKAQEHQRDTAWLDALPMVGVWGQWSWTDNSALVNTAWVEGGLEARWTPVAAGTRVTRSRAGAQRTQAARLRLEDAQRGVAAELAAARADLISALAQVDARDRALADATEASRLLAARYAQGLTPLTDVLAVDASLASQRAARVQARADATAAWLAWQLARGQTPRTADLAVSR